MPTFPRIVPASDRSVLVVFGTSIDVTHHERVRRLVARLQARPHAAVRNLHPAYASLLVTFDARAATLAAMEDLLGEHLGALGDAELAPPHEVTIPVCYDADLGPDLEAVARLHGLDVEDVVRLHAGGDYRVYFLGFSPGFPYMGGLPPRLATPRLPVPRTRVPAGSVAIGGDQAGIYPTASPGGWRILGRTPLALLRPQATPPVLVQMGDRVRFERIDRATFARLATGAMP